MEKEFISYEQALALKELGFDEKCLTYYYNQILVFTPIPSLNTNSFWVGKDNNFITAPLKQQVFRWFREKYNYDISVRGASFRANWVIGVPLLINNDSKDGYPLVISWDYKTSDGMKVLTYEEAENACIDKLIELVKKK